MTIAGHATPSPDPQGSMTPGLVGSMSSGPAGSMSSVNPAVAQAHPPPPGPGVQPPFVAPPTDGVKRRRWLVAGLASGAAVLCCIGGVFGVGGLVALGGQMIIDQSRAAVTEYLTAIRDRDFPQAYQLLCDSVQNELSPREFEIRNTLPFLGSFVVGDPVVADTVEVPATLRYSGGVSRSVTYLLEQDSSTGEFEVCGQED